MSYESNAGTYYVPLTCGVATLSGTDISSNKTTYYVGKSANDFILWGQENYYSHVQSNSGTQYYFYQCDVPSDMITIPATPAFMSGILYGTEFSDDFEIASISGTTKNTGTSANGATLYFEYQPYTSLDFYHLSGFSHQIDTDENIIYIPYGMYLIFGESLGGTMQYVDGGYSFEIPQPCKLEYNQHVSGKPRFTGLIGTGINEDWSCYWEPSLSAWILDNSGYTFLGYDLSNSTNSPVEINTWTKMPSSSAYMIGNVSTMNHYTQLSAVENYINNTFNADETATVTLSVSNYDGSQEFGIENRGLLFDDGNDPYQLPYDVNTNAGTHYYYSSAFNCVSFCDPIEPPHY